MSLENQVKVLIVDDSEVASRFLAHVIESDPKLKVIGFAKDGMEALEMLVTISPDVITMDISMPKLNGFDATRKIMQTHPIPIVIVSGLYTKNDIDAGFKAIDAGALAILSRPTGPLDPQYASMAKSLIDTIKVIAGIKLVTRKKEVISEKPSQAFKGLRTDSIKAIGIGASLGGPPALEKILSVIPHSFPIPIFIVQHISQGFTQGLADWLKKTVSLEIEIPKHGQRLEPGHVYLAPDNNHMIIDIKGEIHLLPSTGKEICPSVNKLLNSMAQSFGKEAIGIILTGMGQDGAEGLLAMKRKGAVTIVQDPEECVMYSMPKAARDLGASDHSFSIEEISSFIQKIVPS